MPEAQTAERTHGAQPIQWTAEMDLSLSMGLAANRPWSEISVHLNICVPVCRRRARSIEMLTGRKFRALHTYSKAGTIWSDAMLVALETDLARGLSWWRISDHIGVYWTACRAEAGRRGWEYRCGRKVS